MRGSSDCLFGNRASNIARARELLALPVRSKQPETPEAVLDAVHNGTLKIADQISMFTDAPTIGAFENPTQ